MYVGGSLDIPNANNGMMGHILPLFPHGRSPILNKLYENVPLKGSITNNINTLFMRTRYKSEVELNCCNYVLHGGTVGLDNGH